MPSGIYDRSRRLIIEKRYCLTCAKPFKCKETLSKVYCSVKCINKNRIPKNKLPRETRICECGCGKIFECKINSIKRFISGHNNRGKTFDRRQEKVKQQISNTLKRKYSSGEIVHSMKGLTKETASENIKRAWDKMKKTKETTVKGKTYEEIHGIKKAVEIRKKKLKFKDTSIELELDKILDGLNISYKKQKYELFGTPDRFIEPNICLFVDGEYWHNYPSRTEHDNDVTKKLSRDGYEVLRFWGNEVKKKKDFVKSEIKEAIGA